MSKLKVSRIRKLLFILLLVITLLLPQASTTFAQGQPDEYGNIYCYPGQNVPSAMCPNPYKTWRWLFPPDSNERFFSVNWNWIVLFAFACVRILKDYTVLIAPFVTSKATNLADAKKLAEAFNSNTSQEILDSWVVGMEVKGE